MCTTQQRVSTIEELLAAIADERVLNIAVTAELTGVPTLRLARGQILSGVGSHASIRFATQQDGLQLSADNWVDNLQLATDPDRRAIFNDTTVHTLGRLVLRNLSVTGVVQLLACGEVRSGHVDAHHIDIVAADARGCGECPKGYGVEVTPGAFTLWNQQPDPAVTITADLTDLSAGRAGAPVHGSGIFVSGAGEMGGRLIVRRLETGAIYSHGGIAPGTPDRITGGVFTAHGTFVDSVRNHGCVTTYGPNDMVLDNWGTVGRWVAEDKITSYGPIGIGFVNLGSINVLQFQAPIETFGRGARGFNAYAGTVQSAAFERVVTHGDGAAGIQISRPVGRIMVRHGIETHGGTGDSMIRGMLVTLSAIALSVKPGGWVQEVEIAGGLVTHSQGIDPLELHGSILSLRIGGGITASGSDSDRVGG